MITSQKIDISDFELANLRSKVAEGWVPIQLAKKPLEKSLEKTFEKPQEISYTGKTPKIGSLDMSQNQIWISSGFSSHFSSGLLAN